MFRAFRLAIFRAAKVSRLLSEVVAERGASALAGSGICWLGDIKRGGERVVTGADLRVTRTGVLEFIFVVFNSRDGLDFLTSFATVVSATIALSE